MARKGIATRLLRVLACLFLVMGWGCGNVGEIDPGPPGPQDPAPAPHPSPSELSLHFFAFGDSGTGGPDQAQVAAALRDFCDQNPCDFGFLLGDNFYDTGVNSVTDPQWASKFETVYSGLNFLFYAVLGNHDHGQGSAGVQAQIDYTQVQERWVMPAEQYLVTLPADSSPPLIEFFALDSTDLSVAQADQLDQWLAASRAQWKILVMHHPVYSNGNHGDDSAGNNALLVPLICSRVDLVLSGHDHLFGEFINPNGGDDGCPFHQVVAGTGGQTLYATTPHSGALYSESTFGFLSVAVGESALSWTFIRSDGTAAYTNHLLKAP